MTIAFASIAAIFVIERIDERKGALSITPFLVAGAVSILYWSFFEDLRSSSICSSSVSSMHSHPINGYIGTSYVHTFYILVWAAAFYLLAKVEEAAEKLTFELSHHAVSGHTLKHLFAAMVPVFLALMLSKRRVETQRLEKRRARNILEVKAFLK